MRVDLKGGWPYLALALGLFGFYAATMPRDVTFEDTALFAGACGSLGLPHEPGFPAYVLSCYPFARLADLLGSNPAVGAGLYSALCAAAACALLASLARRMLRTGVAPAIAAGGLVGLTPVVINQAQIPEVYALNLLLTALSCVLAQRYAAGGGRRLLPAMALVAGLGLAVHWPLFVLVYPAALLLLGPRWRVLLADLRAPRLLAACAGALALGLAPFLHLLLTGPPAFVFGGDVALPNGFWSYVARSSYGVGGDEFSVAGHLVNIGTLANAFVGQLHYAFGLLLAVGTFFFARRCGRWEMAALLWGLASTTLLLYLARPYDLEEVFLAWVVSAYPLPANFFGGLAAAAAFAGLGRRWAPPPRLRLLAAAVLLAAAAAAQHRAHDRSGDDFGIRYAELFLAGMEPGDAAWLYTNDYYFTVRYLRHRRGLDYPVDRVVPAEDYFNKHAAEPGAWPERTFANDYVHMEKVGVVYDGVKYQVLPPGSPAGVSVALTPEARRFIADAAAAHRRMGNEFTRLFLDDILKKASSHLTAAALRDGGIGAEDRELYAAVLATGPGQYARFITRVAARAVTPRELRREFAKVAPYMAELIPEWRAEILQVMASSRILAGDLAGGRAILEQALAAFPSSDNGLVLIDLLQVLAHQGEFEAYRRLRRRYPDFDSPALAEYERRCQEALRTPSCAPS